MFWATNLASAAGHRQVPAAASWNPMKCTTRQEATASVGDQDVPDSAAETRFIRLGTASRSASALASSWATRASVGEPPKTLYSNPFPPNVQPVLVPGMKPQCVDVSPMLQLQFDPGSIPAASTSATRVATGGSENGTVIVAECTGTDVAVFPGAGTATVVDVFRVAALGAGTGVLVFGAAAVEVAGAEVVVVNRAMS
jgi:hypothetical protein